jgi:hypothetical protein
MAALPSSSLSQAIAQQNSMMAMGLMNPGMSSLAYPMLFPGMAGAGMGMGLGTAGFPAGGMGEGMDALAMLKLAKKRNGDAIAMLEAAAAENKKRLEKMMGV